METIKQVSMRGNHVVFTFRSVRLHLGRTPAESLVARSIKESNTAINKIDSPIIITGNREELQPDNPYRITQEQRHQPCKDADHNAQALTIHERYDLLINGRVKREVE